MEGEEEERGYFRSGEYVSVSYQEENLRKNGFLYS